MPTTARRLYEEAERLEEQGAEEEALECWKRLSELKQHPIIFRRIALLAKKMGNRQEAEGAYRRAIDLDATFSPAFSGLGSLELDRGRYATAEKLLTEAVRLEATYFDLTLLGIAQRQQGKTEAARESYREALELNPDHAETVFNLGVTYKFDDPEQAITLFRRAIEMDPNAAPSHRELGWMLQTTKRDYSSAEYHMRRALELDPNNPWAHIYLGSLRWHTGDLESTEQEFKTAIDLAPRWTLPRCNLGNLYTHQERWKEAKELFEQALELDPDDVEALHGMGKMFHRSGEDEKAKVYLQRASSLDPADQKVQRLMLEIADSSQRAG